MLESCGSIIQEIGWGNPELAVTRLMNFLSNNGYKLPKGSHSIHNPSSIRFMQSIIGAEQWVLNILVHGVKLDFSSSPPQKYVEPNNKSARTEMEFLRKKVKEWNDEGFVSQTLVKPDIVNPMSVVVKEDFVSGTTKKRPVIDLSRCVNKRLTARPFTMDTLSNCESSVLPNDYQIIFDLENMYFHFRLHEDHKQFFAFSIANEQGENVYYTFNVMCYGYALAGYIVTRVINPIKSFLHRLGIRLSMYIDDGRILAQSEIECKFKAQFVLHIFQLCGFNIQWKKTNLDPSQTAVFQGFITNTIFMKYFIQIEKFSIIQAMIEETLFKMKDPEKWFKLRELAVLLGKIHSLNKSHGSIVSVMTRHIQHVVGKEVFKAGWESSVKLDSHCKRELDFLQEHLFKFNGKLIPGTKEGARTVGHQEISKFIQQVCYSEKILPDLIISDASDSHAFIFYKDSFIRSQEFEFDEEERNLSSGHRELLATLKFLQHCKETKVKFSSSIVYWQTDSKNNFTFLSKGSRKSRIQQDIVKIKFLEMELDITIIPVWTPRSHSRIVLADLGSKFSQSSDEWGISRNQLDKVFKQFNLVPTIDAFASEASSVCTRFFSKIPQNKCIGINFFAQSLNPWEIYFCCPPVKEIVFTFKKLINTPHIRAIFIIPSWYSANFWPFLHNGQQFRQEIKDVMIFSPEFIIFNKVDSLFSRKPNFQMLALKIVS